MSRFAGFQGQKRWVSISQFSFNPVASAMTLSCGKLKHFLAIPSQLLLMPFSETWIWQTCADLPWLWPNFGKPSWPWKHQHFWVGKIISEHSLSATKWSPEPVMFVGVETPWVFINYRRKFRSQSPDNMQRWKRRGGKSQRGEVKKCEDKRWRKSEERRCRCSKR